MPTNLPFFTVTEASKDNNNGFRSSAADTHPVNSLTKSPSSILDSKDLNEKLLLENFGPGTFASAEEIAADEENDAKLWFDLIQSMEIWQNNKLIRAKRKRYSKKFVKIFFIFFFAKLKNNFTNILKKCFFQSQKR